MNLLIFHQTEPGTIWEVLTVIGHGTCLEFRVGKYKIVSLSSPHTSHLPRSQLTLRCLSLPVRIISLLIISSFHHFIITGGVIIPIQSDHQPVSGGCQSPQLILILIQVCFYLWRWGWEVSFYGVVTTYHSHSHWILLSHCLPVSGPSGLD